MDKETTVCVVVTEINKLDHIENYSMCVANLALKFQLIFSATAIVLCFYFHVILNDLVF